MRYRSLFLRCFSLFFLLLFWANPVIAQPDEIDFSGQYERVYQIRVVSKNAGGKSSIGSGFQVSRDGLIVTNYHVVSEYIASPELYDIHYSTHDGRSGQLTLLDFDVISDLAVLRHPDAGDEHFSLADSTPQKGKMAYALGNPGDWGIVMVPGPTNGLVEHSYEDRVLFSGSLNSGMSGGPSLNHEGEVIGVNVATAGSQLSFLVPVDKVNRLLARNGALTPDRFEFEIGEQIRQWQEPRIQELLDASWRGEEFQGRTLFGEIRKDFQCWGDTNKTDKERDVDSSYKTCEAGDDVYITSDINAGQIRFYFHHVKPVKLNKVQFARSQSIKMWSTNDSDFDNSTNYACQTDFIETETDNTGGYHRIITCIRAYKKYKGLYDSLLMVQSNRGSEMFKSHLSLSGVEKIQIQAMNKRFVEQSL